MKRAAANKRRVLTRLILTLLALAMCVFIADRILNPPAPKKPTGPPRPAYPVKKSQESKFSVKLPASFAGLRHELRDYAAAKESVRVQRWFAESDPLIFEIFIIEPKENSAAKMLEAVTSANDAAFQPERFMAWSGMKVFAHENEDPARFNKALFAPELIAKAAAAAGLDDDTAGEISGQILVAAIPDEDSMHINVFCRVPVVCRAMADALADAFLDSAGAHLLNYEKSLQRDLSKEEEGIGWYDREIKKYVSSYGLEVPVLERNDLEQLVRVLELKRIREKLDMDLLYEKALVVAQGIPGLRLPDRPKPGPGEPDKSKPPDKTTKKSQQPPKDSENLSPEQKLNEDLRVLELERTAIDITHPGDKEQMSKLDNEIKADRKQQEEMRRKTRDKGKNTKGPEAERYEELLMELETAGALYVRTDASVKEMKKRLGAAGGLGAELWRLVRERSDRQAAADEIRKRLKKISAKRKNSPARVEITDRAILPDRPEYPGPEIPLLIGYITGAASEARSKPAVVAGARAFTLQKRAPWRTGAEVPMLETYLVHNGALVILRVTAVDETTLERPDVKGFFTSFQFTE